MDQEQQIQNRIYDLEDQKTNLLILINTIDMNIKRLKDIPLKK